MADPVGAVGTAAGLVSLGLQLYGGISTYIDALDGRNDDLAPARAQLETLKRSMQVIEAAIPQLETSLRTKADAILPALASCKDGLDKLEILLQQLVDSPVPVSRLKKQIKTLAFPFHRPSLMKLEDRLQKTNGAINIALVALQINSSTTLGAKLSTVEANTNQLPQIESTLSQLSINIGDLKTSTRDISVDMESAAIVSQSSSLAVDHLVSEFATFAPATNTQLTGIQQSITGLPQRSDITEIASTTANSELHLQHLDANVQQMRATTEASLAQLSTKMESIYQSWQHVQHALGMEGEVGQGQSHIILGRLLAKPSQTKELYDQLLPLERPAVSPMSPVGMKDRMSNPYTCRCMQHRNRTTTTGGIGPFHWRGETTVRQHDRKCRLSSLNTKSTSRLFQLMGSLGTPALSLGLQLSLALTTGAGGFSISSQIRYRHIVDMDLSPTFRIMGTMQYAVSGHWTDLEMYHMVQTGLNLILRLYRERKAAANDINMRGHSIFHEWANLYEKLVSDENTRKKSIDLATLFARTLIQMGVSADGMDSYGYTPAALLAYRQLPTADNEGLQILYDAAPESVLSARSISYFDQVPIPRTPLEAAVFDCGILGTAIAANDKHTISRLMNDNTALLEVNSWGQTPLHQAVNDPILLRALLEASNYQLLNAFDRNDFHIIDYVLKKSAEWCLNGSDWVHCSGCTCSEALGYLLSLEGCLEVWLGGEGHKTRLSLEYTLHLTLRCASHDSRIQFLQKLIDIRERLKTYALRHLCERECRHFGLFETSVLDYHAFDVVESLDRAKVAIPPLLRAQARSRTSLYHYLYNTKLTQLAYDLGFRDLDLPDNSGATPILHCLSYGRGHSPINNVTWLLSHGANPATQLATVNWKQPVSAGELLYFQRIYFQDLNPMMTVAHLIAWDYAIYLLNLSFIENDIAKPIKDVLALPYSDCCKCLCSESGCTPASLWFLRPCLYCDWDHRKLAKTMKKLEAHVKKIIVFFEMASSDWVEHHKFCVSGLRAMTFEILGLEHTCCRINDSILSDEEIDDIWDAERDLIDLLEGLNAEFQMELEKQGFDFGPFLISYWLPRMEEVLSDLNARQMTKEEITATTQIGVEWNSEDSGTTGSDTTGSVYDAYKDCMRSLEEIAMQNGISDFSPILQV